MKQYIFFLLMAFSLAAFAQAPTLEDLPNKFKREYKQDQREAEKEAKRLEREGWDIVPDPTEVAIPLPKSYFDPGSLQIISWQTQLQRVAELENRIKAECTFPVHFKISDSGVDQTHPDLQQGFTGEFDWSGEGHNPGSHGTHVCGDILQFMYPLVQKGIVTYDDQKSLQASGSGSFAWAANMFLNQLGDVEQRTAQGQTVVYNCSWGGGTAPIASVEAMLKKTVEAGGIIVAAAGNSGGAVGYPGNSIYALGISSLDQNMVISSFSSRGPEVDGCAGGRNIYSTLPGGGYGLMSGTSMASPSWAAIFVGYARAKWGPQRLPDYAALMAYYKQIAVQVGNGDPNLYGFGYPYIEAILNTAPGTPTPPDDPTDPPPPTPGTYFTAGTTDAGFMMPWKREGEQDFKYLYVPSISFHSVGDKGEDETHAEALAFIQDYFQSRAIVLTVDMDWYSATKWTGRFLNLVAKNEGLLIEVQEITGKDMSGSGLTYYADDFSYTPSDLMAELFGVRLIDRE
jgi:hypothetical protein